MRESLFSPLWYRVSNLHPQLRSAVRVQRQHYRDQVWFQLIDGTSDRQFRVNAKAFQFVGRCDGRHTVQEIWDTLLNEQHDDAPTQDEVVRLLAQLDEQELLIYEATPDAQTLVKRRDRRVKQRRRAFVNPFAFRVSLGDPSALIRRLDWLAAMVLNPIALWVWIAAMTMAAAAIASNWQALTTHAATHMGTPHYLLLAWLSFPFIKALHEIGHAIAVRRWGADVRQAGITLFVLIPAPYVDASAATGFRPRYQRVVVSAMGIMVELSLAAIALLVWLNVQPGLVRDVAFVTMFIASVSTVVFNANPLLTFDGYYVLCDALDLPNLASRSRNFWAERIQRFALGTVGESNEQHATGEKKWLLLYAPLSIAYRLFVSGLIVLWVGSQSVALGVVAAIFVLISVCVAPLYKLVSRILAAAPAGPQRFRARATITLAAIGFWFLIFAIPLPSTTLARGVVWLPDKARIRAGTDGFVSEILAKDGAQVEAGQLLLLMDDPALFVERNLLARKLTQYRADQYSVLLRDPARAQNFDQEIARVENELHRIEERIDHLTIRSQTAGRLVMPNQNGLHGAFSRRGDTLGYVLSSEEIGVRAALPERDAALVRETARSISVRLAESPNAPVRARMVREIPAATHDLPSAALGDRGGGPYVTDPADEEGLRALEPVVLIDLKLPEVTLKRVGGRVWVRFNHEAEPLATQWYRRVRQLFLQHFNPTG